MATWTKGELRRIVHEDERGAAIEVLKALCDSGPNAIAWDDETDPEAVAEAKLNRELSEWDEEGRPQQ